VYIFDYNGINKTKPLSHKNNTHKFTVSRVYRNLKEIMGSIHKSLEWFLNNLNWWPLVAVDENVCKSVLGFV